MSARDRKAVDYAKGRLTAALEVLAEMETHGEAGGVTPYYAAKLRAALGVGNLKLKCGCATCKPS